MPSQQKKSKSAIEDHDDDLRGDLVVVPLDLDSALSWLKIRIRFLDYILLCWARQMGS